MSLQLYLDLNLDEAAQRLERKLEMEANRRDEINLTDLAGPQPSHLTPQMDLWYQGTIASVRQPAMSELARMFREQLGSGEERGFLLEKQLAQIDNEYVLSKRACLQQIQTKFHDEVADLQTLSRTIPERRNEYRRRHDQIGKDAKVLNKPLYALGLLGIVVTESFINFASFSSLSWATPFIATGSTLIVAALVTLAAHLHGSGFKQYDFHFGPAARDNIRSAGIRNLIIGVAALFVALAFVYYARSAYLAVYLASLGAFGLSSQGHSPLWIIGGSLLGNVAVYLAGIGWAYLLHDQDPNFARLKEDLDRDEARQKKLQKVVNAEKARRLDQLHEEWKKNVEETKRANKQFIEQPFFSRPKQLLAQFQAKDAGVMEILETYRGNLLAKARDAGAKLIFTVGTDSSLERSIWNESEYERQPLRIKYLEE